MRTVFRASVLRPRRLLRGLLLFVGLFAVVTLAMVGAVIALGVIAVGAVVHGVLALARGKPSTAPARPGRAAGPAIIEGEYRVIGADAGAGKPLTQTG